MTAYQRDDGAEMVETKPGHWVRRDVALALGLAVPVVGVSRRPTGFASASEVDPHPVEPPPLQPSHEDLVSIAPEPAVAVEPAAVARALLDNAALARRAQRLIAKSVTGEGIQPAAPTRTPKLRPAKRPLSAILAEASRNQRSRRPKVKA